MPLFGGVALGAGALVGGIAGYFGDRAQANAALAGQQLTAEQIAQATQGANLAAGSSMSRLAGQLPEIYADRAAGYGAGQDFATQGFGQQRSDLMQGGQLAAGAIGQGQGQSLAQMYAGAGQGIDYTNSGLQSGVGAIGDRSNRSGAMLDQPGGMYGNYQADPGYQFRLQQGEQAIRNMQAAQGGRLGGAAAKELVDYNQNMASQEFGNYANRQNQLYGANSAADAQSLSAQSNLASQYANAGNQAAGMAYGAGQGGAGIYGQGAQSLANIYAGTGTQLGGQAAQAGQTLGGAASNYYNGLGDLKWNTAAQMNQYQMGAAQVPVSLVPAVAANNQAGVPFAGAGGTAVGNIAGGVGNAIATGAVMSQYGPGNPNQNQYVPPQQPSPYPR